MYVRLSVLYHAEVYVCTSQNDSGILYVPYICLTLYLDCSKKISKLKYEFHSIVLRLYAQQALQFSSEFRIFQEISDVNYFHNILS
jgi:hypothetical protein